VSAVVAGPRSLRRTDPVAHPAVYIERKIIHTMDKSHEIAKDSRTLDIKARLSAMQRQVRGSLLAQTFLYGFIVAFPYLWVSLQTPSPRGDVLTLTRLARCPSQQLHDYLLPSKCRAARRFRCRRLTRWKKCPGP